MNGQAGVRASAGLAEMSSNLSQQSCRAERKK